MKKELIAWVGEHEDEPLVSPVVISQLMRLQQFALGYLEYDPDTEKFVMSDPSSKIDAVMELMADNPDEPLLIFSQFKSPLVLLKHRLDKAGIKYGSITGDDNDQARRDAIAGLANGAHKIVVGTIGAGGTGTDGLQERCSTVIFLDRAWSPAANRQAEDRLHRGGQTKPVSVITIVANGTIDVARNTKIEKKWSWVKEVLGH